MSELLLKLNSIKLLSNEEGINDLTLEIYSNYIYKFIDFTTEDFQLIDLYLSGKIRKHSGFSLVPKFFAYQSDLQWINKDKSIDSINSWLMLEKESEIEHLKLTKINILRELNLYADIRSSLNRLDSNQLDSFIIASFLFQNNGIILCTMLNKKNLSGNSKKYWQMFFEKSNCAIIVDNNIPIKTNKKIIIINK